jgi:hypothetical protein
VNDYDLVLEEHWSDRHTQIAEECAELEHKKKCKSGLSLLRWTHRTLPSQSA